MKLLIRNSNGDLIWQDAIYKNSNFRSLDEKFSYSTTDIYAIKDDDRNKTVICSACHKEVPNTPAARKAHQNMVYSKDKCFECSYLYKDKNKILSHKYVLNEDGTYTESTKENVNLWCGINWRRRLAINSEDANRYCHLAACQNATFKPIEDFWTKYPGAFDEFITADRIIDTGYVSSSKYNGNIWFELKGKVRLIANVNGQGICKDFTLRYHRCSHELRYSKKYDKAWIDDYGTFKELSTLDLAESTKNSIMCKLRTLYE